MSEVMLIGILRMPKEIWRDSEIDKYQRECRYNEAADLIESLQEENEKLEDENDYIKSRQEEDENLWLQKENDLIESFQEENEKLQTENDELKSMIASLTCAANLLSLL